MATAPATKASRLPAIRSIALSILVNGMAPYFAYAFLKGQYHLSDIAALSLIALIPAADSAVTFARRRHLDVFGIFVLSGIVVGLALVLLGGNARLLLVRESLLTGVFGLVMLGSMLVKRPIIFYFALHFQGGNDPTKRAEFQNNWKYPFFRQSFYIFTAAWGIVFVAEAIARTIMAFNLPVQQFLAAGPVVSYGFIGAGILFSIVYGQIAMRQGMAIRRKHLAEMAAQQAESAAQ